MRYTLLLSAILALAQVTGSHLDGTEKPTDIDEAMLNDFIKAMHAHYREEASSLLESLPSRIQGEVALDVAPIQLLTDWEGFDHAVANEHLVVPGPDSENGLVVPSFAPQNEHPRTTLGISTVRTSRGSIVNNAHNNDQSVRHEQTGFREAYLRDGSAPANLIHGNQEMGAVSPHHHSSEEQREQITQTHNVINNPTGALTTSNSPTARPRAMSINIPPFSNVPGYNPTSTQAQNILLPHSIMQQPIVRPGSAGSYPPSRIHPVRERIHVPVQSLAFSNALDPRLVERSTHGLTPNLSMNTALLSQGWAQQANLARTTLPGGPSFAHQGVPNVGFLNRLPPQDGRQFMPTDRYGIVNNTHNIQNIAQNGPQKARQPVHPLALTATFKIVNLAPPAMKNWFGGDTWRDIDFRMSASYKEKMPLSFRQHSTRTIGGTRPEKNSLGIEGKGNQFGFRLKPSFLAVYDGEWMRSDNWIKYRTKNFKTEINGEYQDLLGCREFAEALSDEERLTELGIDKDGIFALLVASWDKTEIRVLMTENSPVALRVLRPANGVYEMVASSVPGELVSCSVEENYVVIMGQSSEMELLGKLKVEDSFKSLLYQLSDDHFWTVSILSKQQTVHDNLEPQTAVNDGSVTNQSPAPPQEEAGWFHEPNQFVIVPSYVDSGKIGRTGSGICGKSAQFSFIVKPGFIVLTKGHRQNFTGQTNSYNLDLVKAIKGSELESKKSFGIEQNGLCAILETIEGQKDEIRMYLHVRVIGQIPVTLKVMRRIGNTWVETLGSESGNRISCEILEGDVVIVKEVAEVEQNLPIESDDLFSELRGMTESPFHFLIVAQLVKPDAF